jgi:preprotein translocase subunit SecF
MQLFKTTHIDFIGKRKFFYVLSALITLAGLAGALIRGVEYGIDFEGGTEVALDFQRPVEPDALRGAAESAGFEGAEVKSYGDGNQYLVRIKNEQHDQGAVAAGGQRPADKLRDAIAAANPDNKVTLLKADNIGPKIGAELRQDALWAVIVAMAAILLYITFRYEFVLGVAAILALLHDVLVTFSITVL